MPAGSDSETKAAQVVLDVRPTPADVTAAAAAHIVDAAAVAVAAAGRFTIALSGGSTPRALYTLLATTPYASRIDWSRVHVFWGDERCVPPDHPGSNYRMTREVLLDPVKIPPANVHRIHGEDEPHSAAAAYDGALRQAFPVSPAQFDLMLLGMGDNGHTASLFPGLTAVQESARWVVAEYVAEVSMWRVTLTPAIINAAAHVLLLVAGADKAPMLRRVLEGPRDPNALPVQIVKPAGQLTWLVDAAAASHLTRFRG
ncbi:MAG: 6-phosphogluconolactonase [Deltaproteobacteria bacterium]|nr:6-phosphogluconolactonase [Deltaproteobacteria bacterium]